MEHAQITEAMTSRQWAGIGALAVAWGGSFFFISVAVKELPPLTIVSLRLLLAAPLLLIFARLSGARLPRRLTDWLAFTRLGFLNNALPFVLYAWAQTHIGGGLAAVLNATQPLFTVVVAHLATADEKMTARHMAGAIIGLAGVGVMIGADALGLDSRTGTVIAELAGLAGALSYACGAVAARKIVGFAPVAMAAAQIAMAAMLTAPVALLVDRPWLLPWPSSAAITALLGQALFSTAFAYILFFRILTTAGALNVGLVTFLNPAVAILLGAVVMGERLDPLQLAGMAVIGVGLASLDGRPVAALWAARRRLTFR